MKFVPRLTVLFTLLAALSLAHASWELRVCLDPNQLPFSNAAGEGIDNKVAAILADELGAELVPVWASFEAMEYVRTDLLYAGKCDLVMGIEDSSEGFMTTVGYYGSPYVFVYRDDAPFTLATLEDDVLAELRIGVAKPGSAPHHVLLGRGLRGNVSVIEAGDYRDEEYLAAPVAAVGEGRVDVTIDWGPIAGYYASRSTTSLQVVPVTPEVYLPHLLMVHFMTIGVRPGDEALRDALNEALARRWPEVQAALGEFGFPMSSLPAPRATVPSDSDSQPVLAGVIVPMTTGPRMKPSQVVGNAAMLGARLAEERSSSDGGAEIDVLLANAPDATTAERAARRLIERQGVTALIGGVGDEQAMVLAKVARDSGVVFLNIGSLDQRLRSRELENTFSVEASAEMYLRSTLAHHGNAGVMSWAVVHEAGAAGDSLLELLFEVVAGLDGATVTSVHTVPANQVAFTSEISRLASDDADGVILLLPARQQEYFLGQYRMFALEKPVAVLPHPVSQSREAIAGLAAVAGEAGAGHRLALWEATLPFQNAADLTALFSSRWGEPMDPSAWAGYAAVRILEAAADDRGADSPADLAAYLTSGHAVFDLHKGEAVHFDAATHQLVQPLYVIEIDPEAAYAPTLQGLTELARFVEVAP